MSWEVFAGILAGLVARRVAGQCCAIHCQQDKISIQMGPFDPPRRIPTWDAFDLLASGMTIAEYFAHRIKRGCESQVGRGLKSQRKARAA